MENYNGGSCEEAGTYVVNNISSNTIAVNGDLGGTPDTDCQVVVVPTANEVYVGAASTGLTHTKDSTGGGKNGKGWKFRSSQPFRD